MRLAADGTQRRFYYDTPRQGLKDVGVQTGTLLFDGQRVGMTYRGTAYTFSRNCGNVGYPVSGDVAPDERSVTLIGKAPLLGSRCETSGFRDETLYFRYLGQ
jgi:hypothetical protein